ncbi:hypothetical protein [Nocardia arthritidis]|uniref:Uncharacterized protein n=1 Tax=Nocardia arthritidis TaxID=228602 RepID=A0A6G9YMF3_9NOCA|nr:hypothetical protein [Nocardia arthritidis]QIS14103.1 hypothetical protein F5544_31305 [Nocardia arthritidis]
MKPIPSGTFEQIRAHLAAQLPVDWQQIYTTALPVKHPLTSAEDDDMDWAPNPTVHSACFA